MNELKYYCNLSEFIDKEDLEKELEILLLEQIGANAEMVLAALDELATRYVDAGYNLSQDIYDRLNKKLLKLWDMNSLANTELVVGIIINFELFEAYRCLKSDFTSVKVSAIRKELEDTFSELGSWGK